VSCQVPCVVEDDTVKYFMAADFSDESFVTYPREMQKSVLVSSAKFVHVFTLAVVVFALVMSQGCQLLLKL